VFAGAMRYEMVSDPRKLQSQTRSFHKSKGARRGTDERKGRRRFGK
jgi:hypothetical protein